MSDSRPSLTIGIPVFNEEKNIGKLLTDLQHQAKVHDTEIIVLSSGSTDSTNEIVGRFESVRLLIEPNRKGKASAVSKLMKEASGDILIMTDGDVLFDKDLIQNIVREFEDKPIVALTGRVIPLRGISNFFFKLSEVGCNVWDKYRTRQSRAGQFVYPTGYLYALKKNIYKGLQIDHSVVNDDAIIGLKVWKNNIQFHYARQCKIYVLFPQCVSEFVNQKIRTRVGRRQNGYKHFFKVIECEWRKILYESRMSRYVIVYILLDFYCRTIAGVEVAINRNANIWKPVKSTKLLSESNEGLFLKGYEETADRQP